MFVKETDPLYKSSYAKLRSTCSGKIFLCCFLKLGQNLEVLGFYNNIQTFSHLHALTINAFFSLRGSLGFGEEALQSLPGNIGSQVIFQFFLFLYYWFYFPLFLQALQSVQERKKN